MEKHEFCFLQELPIVHLPGLSPHECLVVEHTWLVMAIIVISLVFVIRGWKTVPGGLQNVFEFLTEFIENYLVDVVGPTGLAYFPLAVSIMVFILFASYLGMIPGMMSPTAFLSTNAAMGIIVFVFYQYVGITRGGFKYLKHFLGPTPAMAPIMLPVEIVSELARPFSLSVRLFSNIFGGEMIAKVLAGFLAVGLPVLWMIWDSAFTIPIQGFIFSLLTMAYLAGAVTADEGH